jgi:hypothetical protein
LENELYSLSLKAANTRNSIYEKHAEKKEKEKEKFNADLKKKIIISTMKSSIFLFVN